MTVATAIAFDFEKKQEREIPIAEAAAACADGKSCWIDIDVGDPAEAERLLAQIGVGARAIDEALSHPVGGRCDVHGECIHAAISAA